MQRENINLPTTDVNDWPGKHDRRLLAAARLGTSVLDDANAFPAVSRQSPPT